jgi:hypothetical protein
MLDTGHERLELRADSTRLLVVLVASLVTLVTQAIGSRRAVLQGRIAGPVGASHAEWLPLLQRDAMRCNAMRCDAMQRDAMQRDATRCNAMQ